MTDAPAPPPERGKRTRAQVSRDYREAKDKRGECRECKRPVKIKSNGKPGKLCADHATADANRKIKAP